MWLTFWDSTYPTVWLRRPISKGGFVQANADGTMFLERGQRGIVPCPLVISRQISPGDVDAMYWYYGSTSGTSLLISYFLGWVAPQNGIPEGVYDIDNEFNLIIENVTASCEGTYYFQLKPRLKIIEEGQVEVRNKVSPSRPYPTVIGCNQDHDANTCEVRVRHDSTVHNLTCVMEQVKPAVELRWIRLFLGGKTELNAYRTVRPVVLPAYTSSSLRNNTYSTSASIQVPSVDDDAEYVCEAVGVAVGNSTRTRVRLTKTHPTPAAHGTTATRDTMATHDTTESHDTTATRDTTATHDKTGTTSALDGEVVRTDYSIGTQTTVFMIAPMVISSMSLLCSAVCMSCVCMLFRRQKDTAKPMPNVKYDISRAS
ncbi:uncharacterized protein LOC119738362 isoform X2 [Patiria miniata]|uniref:Ig-like domain-containing protein n=1 Tax=Patiria miniata TaxID=46514 RepID=A0A914AZM9_PATMI|nr:uncharacterized protein LOC119738362 isoform X2 [Patiria miniata]